MDGLLYQIGLSVYDSGRCIGATSPHLTTTSRLTVGSGFGTDF